MKLLLFFTRQSILYKLQYSRTEDSIIPYGSDYGFQGGHNMSLIKDRLVEELRYSPYTTVELAKKVGVSPEMITQYRTTDKLPKLETFAALCKALDCSADYILGLTDRP